jgi:hypothetical protein
MPGQRLSIYVPSVSFRAIEMGRHFHGNGITVNKTAQTVESVAPGATIRLEERHNPALLFRCQARAAP